MRALLVHNPTAGSGRPSAEELLAALDQAGFSTTYYSSKEDAYKSALAHPTDVLIIAGGDGTVGKVTRRISDRKTLVAILPVGTANNVARCMGIFGEPPALIAAMRGAPVRRLDMGIAAGPWGSRHFLESVGWGAFAKAVTPDGDRKPPREERIERGRKGFAETLAKAKPKHFTVTADGNEIEEDFIFVEVLNLGMTGPRMLISPSAETGDQLLDVVYLTEARRHDMIDWLEFGDHERPPPVQVAKARKVTFHWDEGPLRIDDDVFSKPELPSNIILELERESLRICVPPGPDEHPAEIPDKTSAAEAS